MDFCMNIYEYMFTIKIKYLDFHKVSLNFVLQILFVTNDEFLVRYFLFFWHHGYVKKNLLETRQGRPL